MTAHPKALAGQLGSRGVRSLTPYIKGELVQIEYPSMHYNGRKAIVLDSGPHSKFDENPARRELFKDEQMVSVEIDTMPGQKILMPAVNVRRIK